MRRAIVEFLVWATPTRVQLMASRSSRLSRLLSKSIGSGVETVSVRRGPLAGMRLRVDLAREKAYWSGTYELNVQNAMQDLPLDGAYAWDIGAHVGFFSLVLATRCRRVLAVEPSPANLVRLRENASLNPVPIEVVDAAVDERTGEMLLLENGEESTLHPDQGVPVQTRTLDSLLTSYGRPDFVKMDIEGRELLALQAAPAFLAARPVLLLELHGDNRETVPTLLEEHGYRLRHIAAGRVIAEPD
jgi:FkbM family methyltransferase